MRKILNWTRHRLSTISNDTLTKTFANLLSEILKPFFALFILWLCVVGSSVLGLLNATIQLPLWLLLNSSLVLFSLPILLIRVWSIIGANKLQRHEGILWKVEENRLLDEGPFCPNDKRSLEIIQPTRGYSDMIGMMESQGLQRSIKLRCPQCEFGVSFPLENLEKLRNEIQDRIAAQKR